MQLAESDENACYLVIILHYLLCEGVILYLYKNWIVQAKWTLHAKWEVVFLSLNPNVLPGWE